MTNLEKYREEIAAIISDGDTIAVMDGKPTSCNGFCDCTKCEFYTGDCGAAAVDWMLKSDGESSTEALTAEIAKLTKRAEEAEAVLTGYGFTTARQQGQEEAWALAQNIGLSKDYGGMSPEEFIEIFGDGCYRCEILRDYTYAEAVEKVRAWEEKQNAQVGDVYKRKGTEEIVVVTHIDENGLATYLRSDGSCGNSKRHRFDIWAEKTGRTLPVEDWLRQIGGSHETED